MNVALVHDWLTGMRGGEKCLEVLCELFPRAHLYTLVWNRGTVSKTIEGMPIHPSFVDRIPGKTGGYRHYLPVFPRAIESLDVRGYDLIISTSHCVAKGAIPGKGSLCLCYCLTPMRYVWELEDVYFTRERYGFLRRWAIGQITRRLRSWDKATVNRVHTFAAISRFVAARIKEHYGRDAEVIFPPVDTDYYRSSDNSTKREDFFLIVSALVPYKKIEIAMEAFRGNPSRLLIIGQGTERRTLERTAPSNVRFLGRVGNEVVRDHYRRCRAVLFPGIEDFGIVPLEAQACGAPVIAYRAGGALETVLEKKTGLFFDEQTPHGLRGALEESQRVCFDESAMRRNAERFSRARFVHEIKEFIRRAWDEHRGQGELPW